MPMQPGYIKGMITLAGGTSLDKSVSVLDLLYCLARSGAVDFTDESRVSGRRNLPNNTTGN